MAVEMCVYNKLLRDLIACRDRLKSLSDQVSAVSVQVDWAVDSIADLIKERDDGSVEASMVAASARMADAIIETQGYLLGNLSDRDHRNRCLDLLQAAMDAAASGCKTPGD
jgi:hypothetical protein